MGKQNKHLMKLKNIRQESGNPFKVMIVSGQNPRWYGGPLTSYVCFWKPMHTNAAGIYWYMFEIQLTQPSPSWSNATRFVSRISHSVQPVWLQGGKHLPSNMFQTIHFVKNMIQGWFSQNAVQISPRKFCKWQRCLEFVAVTFFLSFSFRCFNTDLFIILP